MGRNVAGLMGMYRMGCLLTHNAVAAVCLLLCCVAFLKVVLKYRMVMNIMFCGELGMKYDDIVIELGIVLFGTFYSDVTAQYMKITQDIPKVRARWLIRGLLRFHLADID